MAYERYVCNVSNCKAVLVLKDGVLRRADNFKSHLHEDQEDKYERDKFDNRVKEEIRTSVTGINEIFNNNLTKDEKGGANIPFNKKRRNYARIRSGTTPAGPKTLEDIVSAYENTATMKKYGYTSGDPPTLFYHGTVNHKDYGFTIFATEFITRQISEMSERRYFADGTFRVVPSGCFQQLFVVHVELQNHVSLFSSKCYIY